MALLLACQQLTSEERITQFCNCSIDGLADTDFTIDEVIDAASDMVFTITGGRVRGRCETTIRPCADRSCMCGLPSDGCGCCRLDAIPLSGVMVDIVSIQIDGVTLADSEYGLLDGNQLVRVGTDRTNWPGCQYLSRVDGSVGTFSITYEHGILPFVGVMAATEIACDLLTGVTGRTSRLDPRVVTAIMDGVTMDFDPNLIGLFDWSKRLVAQYPSTLEPIVWSPEIDEGWVNHRTSY